eukprot:scaffold35875_cov112-Isochrysis_galbana.AAC.2
MSLRSREAESAGARHTELRYESSVKAFCSCSRGTASSSTGVAHTTETSCDSPTSASYPNWSPGPKVRSRARSPVDDTKEASSEPEVTCGAVGCVGTGSRHGRGVEVWLRGRGQAYQVEEGSRLALSVHILARRKAHRAHRGRVKQLDGPLEPRPLPRLDPLLNLLGVGRAPNRRVALRPALEQTRLPEEIARSQPRHLARLRLAAGCRRHHELARHDNVEAGDRVALPEDGLPFAELAAVRRVHHGGEPVKRELLALARSLAHSRRRQHSQHVVDVALSDVEPQLGAHAAQVVRPDVPLVGRVEELVRRPHHVVPALRLDHPHALGQSDGPPQPVDAVCPPQGEGGRGRRASRRPAWRVGGGLPDGLLVQQGGQQQRAVDGLRRRLEGAQPLLRLSRRHPAVRVGLHQLLDQLPCPARDGPPLVRVERVVRPQYPVESGVGVGARTLKRVPAGQHDVQQHAHRPHVDGRVVRRGLVGLLRRPVRPRPDAAARDDLLVLLQHHGRTEVDELDDGLLVATHQHHILRLDVAVAHAARVHVAPCSTSRAKSSPPAASSMTRCHSPSGLTLSGPKSKAASSSTMFGWPAHRCIAYTSMLSSDGSSSFLSITLMATVRPVDRSTARQTVPEPPLARQVWNSYSASTSARDTS